MNTRPELILVQSDAAAHFLLKGLQQEYLHSVATGRLEAWTRTAYTVIELLIDRAPPVGSAPQSPTEEA